jgi:hypothetical protein
MVGMQVFEFREAQVIKKFQMKNGRRNRNDQIDNTPKNLILGWISKEW